MRIATPEGLEDELVRLRPLNDDDDAAFAAAFVADPELGVAIGVEEDPDEATVRERLRQDNADADGDTSFIEMAIADPATDGFLGIVVLVSFDWRHRRCEVGFWLAPEARGRGRARRAVALLLEWAFGSAGMRRVEMTTLPDNEPVLRLAESLGFTQEGVMRARNFERGRALDIVWLGLLREDWSTGDSSGA